MIFFTSDLHFCHNSIIGLCGRPFKDIEEMNRTLIKNINSFVKENDELYIIGDFYYGNNQIKNTFEYAKKIKCKHKHLICGNHDININELIKANDGSFEDICDYDEIKYKEYRFILFHYPITDGGWNKARAGSIHLHGHLHSKSIYNEENKKRGILKYDVGVDANEYRPISINEIIGYFKSSL